MKKLLCLVYFIVLAGSVFSQINIKDGQFTGIGSFNLGDAVDKFGNSITRMDSSISEGKLSTTYYVSPGNGYHELTAIRFQSFLLSFDQEHKLQWMQLVRLRLKQDSTLDTKKLNKEIEQLVNYTSKITGLKTEKKLRGRYKTVKNYIYQWKGPKAIIELDVSFRGKDNLGYSFVIRWKTPEDEQIKNQ